MANGFNDILDRLASSPNVRGVLLLDAEGLCLGTRGLLSPSLAAPILASAFRVANEDEDHDLGLLRLAKTIAIPHGRRNMILIRQCQRLTLAILKPLENPNRSNGSDTDTANEL